VPPLQAAESETLDEGTLIRNAQMTSGTNVTVKMTIFVGHPMAGIDDTPKKPGTVSYVKQAGDRYGSALPRQVPRRGA
jgi:hypothetical protein